jgi:hypothetical protein
MGKKLISLSIFLALIDFLSFIEIEKLFQFPKVCNTFAFFIGVIDFIG